MSDSILLRIYLTPSVLIRGLDEIIRPVLTKRTMALLPGDRFGSYVVVGPIGAGGMGEVYRVHDSRLRRDIALKVLPDATRLEPGRLARFEQEARALAALNHPGIASIYGVEEGQNGDPAGQPVQALVLELVEGSTLATRVARGPLPSMFSFQPC